MSILSKILDLWTIQPLANATAEQFDLWPFRPLATSTSGHFKLWTVRPLALMNAPYLRHSGHCWTMRPLAIMKSWPIWTPGHFELWPMRPLANMNLWHLWTSPSRTSHRHPIPSPEPKYYPAVFKRWKEMSQCCLKKVLPVFLTFHLTSESVITSMLLKL